MMCASAADTLVVSHLSGFAALSEAHGDQSAADLNPGRTLLVAAFGTLLVLAVFSAFVVTVGDSARSLHAGSERAASATTMLVADHAASTPALPRALRCRARGMSAGE